MFEIGSRMAAGDGIKQDDISAYIMLSRARQKGVQVNGIIGELEGRISRGMIRALGDDGAHDIYLTRPWTPME